MSASGEQSARFEWSDESVAHSLLDSQDDCLFAVASDYSVVAANSAACRFTRLTTTEITGRDLRSLIDVEFSVRLSRAIDRSADGRSSNFRCTARSGESQRQQFLVRIFPERSSHPVIVAYVLLTPIDESDGDDHELAQMLQVSQGGLNAIFNSGATGIIFFDINGQIIESNPAIQRMLSYEPQSLRGMNVVDLVHTADQLLPGAITHNPFNDLLTGERNHYQAIRRYVHQDGHLVWAQVTVSAVRDSDGEIQFFISMMQDISEHKLLEDVAVTANESPASFEESLEQIVEQLAVQLGFDAAHVLLADEDAHRVVPTDIWYLARPDLLEDFRAATISTTFAPGSGHVGRVFQSRVATLDQDLRNSGDSLRLEAAVADGLQTGLFVPMIIHGDVVGIIEFYALARRDVDPDLLDSLTRIAPQLGWFVERERARRALERQSAELERSNRDLDRFASIASHDLQEPLRAIGRSAAILSERYKADLPDDVLPLMTLITEGVDRLERMIQDLLRFSRIRTGEVEFVPVDLNDVLQDVLQDLSVQIQENDARIDVAPMPAVHGNEIELNQVFRNLVSNALKYRSDATPAIRVSANRKGIDWEFAVADNGIGIDPKFHPQVFDIFRRLHPRDQYTGTGIGLAIVQRIVELHNGRLWIESQEGEGSTFFFTLPATGENQEPIDEPATEDHPAGRGQPLRRVSHDRSADR